MGSCSSVSVFAVTDSGKGIALAKKHGYSWEKAKGVEEKFDKSWVKAVKFRNVEHELKSVPFKAQITKG